MNPPEGIRVEPSAPYACGYRIEGADISRGLNAWQSNRVWMRSR
jgi:hypothetical protein